MEHPGQKIRAFFHDQFFRRIHGSQLIYNACWEDPRIDRQLLQLDANSRVVMITSAGCNALDYLLDGPAEIHTVDVNPRQNALLELKMALIRRGNYDDFFQMFGHGQHRDFRRVLTEVEADLSPFAREFWRKKIVFFSPKRRRSFYYHGASGIVAWLFTRYLYLHRRTLKPKLLRLLESTNLEDQRFIYRDLEPDLWKGITLWFVKQPILLSMLGVPRPQIRLIVDQFPGGVAGFIQHKIQRVISEILLQDNYFWRVYLTGSYSPDCCPNYLKRESFEILKSRLNVIQHHTGTLSDLLDGSQKRFTHFVLLDHQDWLSHHAPNDLEREWRLILDRAEPGSRVLMRSAGIKIDFLPPFVPKALRFFPELTESLHATDRVGTYGSLHFAEVL